MRRETPRSLPGMTRAESTAVSPGPAARWRCSPRLTRERAERGSPWLPGDEDRGPGGVVERELVRGEVAALGHPQQAEVAGHAGVVHHPASQEGHRPSVPPVAASATRCMRGIEVAKHETSTRPRVRSMMLSKAGTTSSSPPVVPGRSTFVLSERRARTPRSPHCGQGVEVGALVRGGALVDLEVAAVEQHAGRGLDGQGEAVEDAVGDADGVHPEGADLDRGARDQGPQVGADAPLLQPAPREAQGQSAAVDRGRGSLQRERQGADVVLVAVGQQDPPELSGPLGQVGEVGHDGVDAGHLGRGKQHPRIQEEEVLLPLEDHRVQPELSEPPERNETQGAGGVGTGSSESSSPLLTCLQHSPEIHELHHR